MSSGPGDEKYDQIASRLDQAGYYYSNSLVAATAERLVNGEW